MIQIELGHIKPKGKIMKRFSLALLVTFIVFSSIPSGTAAEGMKGALQLGGGLNIVYPMPMMGLGGYQEFSLQAAGIFFPTDIIALMADFSLALPSTYDYGGEGDTREIEFKTSYLDVLVGMHWPIMDTGFLYLATGISYGLSTLKMSESDGTSNEFDIDNGLGLAFGMGLALPVAENILAHVNIRHRYIKTEMLDDDVDPDSYAYSLGGLETTIGFTIGFGY
jgi:hypothetical protein